MYNVYTYSCSILVFHPKRALHSPRVIDIRNSLTAPAPNPSPCRPEVLAQCGLRHVRSLGCEYGCMGMVYYLHLCQ